MSFWPYWVLKVQPADVEKYSFYEVCEVADLCGIRI